MVALRVVASGFIVALVLGLTPAVVLADVIADSICLVPPTYALPPEKLMFYAGMIAQTFPAD